MTTVRVGVEWVDHFPPSGSPCHQNNLDYCDDRAHGFIAAMGGHGHPGIFEWGDDNAWETDFRHPAFGGDSLNWSDNVHFCYFADHGGNNNNLFSIAFSRAHNSCSGSASQWRLGSQMLKWFVADTCDAVLNTNAGHIVASWAGPMQGAHIVFGFIGTSADAWWTRGVGSDFGDDAGGGARLSNAWLDRAYSWWTGDKPIAISAGESQADAINRRENETINWRDLPVRSTSWLAWKWRS
ncbi:MAG: DUF6345 domain-containing protein [Gaiellaceae bacterium]